MPNRKLSLNISIIVAITAIFYVVYYLLLFDNYLHISISSIISHSHHLQDRKHLLVLGLLPIYIAAMIFGAAMLSIYLGSRLEYFRHRHSKTHNKNL